ncbi:hypothetical protein CEXT_310871 [Caerostris extrusa]|uniref:TIR domain-containing protein n=1 Tax=Caerostris extrusa TaxID=172846 RepID=A0AAV4S5J4_CAEEX|nr:hypothetical protein CEXT_310871 [Caerostris extrusa]
MKPCDLNNLISIELHVLLFIHLTLLYYRLKPFVAIQPQRSRRRHSGVNRGDRREGAGYQVVPSVQALPPGNFLESEWCLLEFKLAHTQALKDHVPRIIIVKLADLPKDDELPKEMQLYLKTPPTSLGARSTSGTSCSTYSRGRSPSRNSNPETMPDF